MSRFASCVCFREPESVCRQKESARFSARFGLIKKKKEENSFVRYELKEVTLRVRALVSCDGWRRYTFFVSVEFGS